MSEPSGHQASARCYCGASALQIEAAARSVVNCHCGQCRQLGGSAFTTWVSYLKSAVQASPATSMVAFQATTNVTRHFCGVCGSHLYTEDVRYPKIVGVPAGVVQGPVPLPTAHYFVDHKAAWHTINDGLPQFGGPSGFEATVA